MPTVATYFKSLKLKNFRCFGNVELDLAGENGNIAQWTLLLGDNGVGKTTLLQCLCWMRPVLVEGEEENKDKKTEKEEDLFKPIKEGTIGSAITGETNDVLEILFHIGESISPLDKDDERKGFQLEAQLWQGVELTSSKIINKNLKSNPVTTKITFYFKDDRTLDDTNIPNPNEETTDIKKQLGEFTEPLLITYGANRGIGFGDRITKIEDEYAANLSSRGTSLHDAEKELTQLQNNVNAEVVKEFQRGKQISQEDIEKTSDGRRLKVFKDVITRILPEVKTISDIEIEPAQVKLRIFDELIPFSELSLGYQTTLTWVLDLSWQLVDNYPESKDPLNEPAIVLIDEIDLHLHPHWQWTIMRKLSSLFARTQFIATSHSPLMVQSMPDANFAIVQETDSTIKIENDPEIVEGWRLDQIINSEYFGLNFSRTPKTEDLFKKRDSLLLKLKRSPAEEKQLKELQTQISSLRTESSPEEDEAMMYLQKAAELLKREELSKNDKDR